MRTKSCARSVTCSCCWEIRMTLKKSGSSGPTHGHVSLFTNAARQQATLHENRRMNLTDRQNGAGSPGSYRMTARHVYSKLNLSRTLPSETRRGRGVHERLFLYAPATGRCSKAFAPSAFRRAVSVTSGAVANGGRARRGTRLVIGRAAGKTGPCETQHRRY